MHRCNFVRGIFGALLSAISVVSSRPDWSLKGNFAVLSACSHELRFQTRPDSSELQTRTTTRSSARKNVANNWQRQTARGDVKLCDGGNRCREDVKNAFPRSDRAVLRCKKMRQSHPSHPGHAGKQASKRPFNFTSATRVACQLTLLAWRRRPYCADATTSHVPPSYPQRAVRHTLT